MALLIFLLFVGIALTIAVGSRNTNGEREVYGKIPLELKTVEAENMCLALRTPEGSIRLETQIISKRDSGVVTNEYSTDFDCRHVNGFFYNSLFEAGWTPTRNESGMFPFFWDTRSEFMRDGFKISVDCGQMKDFRGIRTFAVTCSWD